MKNILLAAITMLTSVCVFAQEGNFHLDKEYAISKTGTIDLTASDAQVFITGSARATAHVKIDRELSEKGVSFNSTKFTVEVTTDAGNLKIRERTTGGSITFSGVLEEKYHINLAVPQGVSLTVHGDDGDYVITNVNGKIALTLDDADATLAGCKGNDFLFRVDDGDIKMDQGRGSLEIRGDDADVNVYHGAFTTILSDVDDGDLHIETSLEDKGSYTMTSEDGSIALLITGGGGSFDINHDDGHVSTDSHFKTVKESEHQTRVILANGSAVVKLKTDDARVKLAAQ